MLCDTKAAISLSMVWSCLHLFFQGQRTPSVSTTATSKSADLAYPFFNFWCQVGGAVGALGGVFAQSLQLESSVHGGMTATGSSVLFFMIGAGTLAIPCFALPAFDVLEMEAAAQTNAMGGNAGATPLTARAPNISSSSTRSANVLPGTGGPGASSSGHQPLQTSARLRSVVHSPIPEHARFSSDSRDENMEDELFSLPPHDRKQYTSLVAGGRDSKTVLCGAEDEGEASAAFGLRRKRSDSRDSRHDSDDDECTNLIRNLEHGDSPAITGGRSARGSQAFPASARSTTTQQQQQQNHLNGHHQYLHAQNKQGGGGLFTAACAKVAISRKAARASLVSVVGQMFDGLRIIATQKYVFLIFIASCNHLAIRTLLELQGTLLVAYVYPYPSDTGFSLWGPNPKHATDQRTGLISAMLLLNGVLNAAVSFYGTEVVIRKFGVQRVLLLTPLLCFVALGIFSMAYSRAEQHSYLQLKTQHGKDVTFYRPRISWNDRTPASDVVTSQGITRLQSCTGLDSSTGSRVPDVRGKVVSFEWKHPETGSFAGFLNSIPCRDVLRRSSSTSLFSGTRRGESAEVIETFSTDMPDHRHRLDRGGTLTENRLQCEQACLDHFPNCNGWSVSSTKSRSASDSGVNQNSSRCTLFLVHYDEEEVEKLAATSAQERLCRIFDYPHSGAAAVRAPSEEFHLIRPKCSFYETVQQAGRAGAIAVILVNPLLRKRVEELAAPAELEANENFLPPTLFVGEKEYRQYLMKFERPELLGGPNGARKTLELHKTAATGGSFHYYALFLFCSFCAVLCNIAVFSFNNPLVEVLYLQTSKTAKVKAKSWISAFGSNFIRGIANRVNATCNVPIFNPLWSMGFAVVWTGAWLYGVREAGTLHEERKLRGPRTPMDTQRRPSNVNHNMGGAPSESVGDPAAVGQSGRGVGNRSTTPMTANNLQEEPGNRGRAGAPNGAVNQHPNARAGGQLQMRTVHHPSQAFSAPGPSSADAPRRNMSHPTGAYPHQYGSGSSPADATNDGWPEYGGGAPGHRSAPVPPPLLPPNARAYQGSPNYYMMMGSPTIELSENSATPNAATGAAYTPQREAGAEQGSPAGSPEDQLGAGGPSQQLNFDRS